MRHGVWKQRVTVTALLIFSNLGVCGGKLLAQMPTAQPAAPPPMRTAKPDPLYEERQNHDPNGIGKFYMGREIARVMGHLGADWLERSEREAEEKPSLLIQALPLQAGMKVADIGAGSGYFTFRLADKLNALDQAAAQANPAKPKPQSCVYAVDIQQEMLDLIAAKQKQRQLDNIESVLGTEKDPKLPSNSLDLILMVDVYHEFSFPYEMTEAMVQSLRPGGRLVFVEYRLEDATVPIKRIHKMSVIQVVKEMSLFPLELISTSDILPRQHILIFQKPLQKNTP